MKSGGMKQFGILQEEDFTIDENGKYILNGPNQSELAGTWYPGDVRYADLDGDDKISKGDNTLENHGDKKIIGNSTPRFQYGITGNISWKNFDLNIFFQGIGKKMFGLVKMYSGVVPVLPVIGKCIKIRGLLNALMLNTPCMQDEDKTNTLKRLTSSMELIFV